MKRQRLLKKVIRIICIQQGITYDDIAHDLNITKGKLLYAIDKEFDIKHKKISDYAKEHLELEINPKVHCILNDLSFREYCSMHDIGYQDFIYERV